MSRAISAAALVVAAVVLAACGSASSASPPSASTHSTSAPARPSVVSNKTPAAGRPALKAHSSAYGRVLFDRGGRVLYLFASDRHGTSTCYGACAQTWPPYTVKLAPTAGTGVRGSLIGVIRRRDGTRQVTYAGHPLYYFVDDRRPGQITCQNVSSFGGLWLVVDPAGSAVT